MAREQTDRFYMRARVLLNLLNELGVREKMKIVRLAQNCIGLSLLAGISLHFSIAFP